LQVRVLLGQKKNGKVFANNTRGPQGIQENGHLDNDLISKKKIQAIGCYILLLHALEATND
jgi:hypothetical protein